MAKIIPSLNLNKTPQSVDNNSLVFAKNIRLLDDGTIGPDNSIETIINGNNDRSKIIGIIPGFDNNIYLFKTIIQSYIKNYNVNWTWNYSNFNINDNYCYDYCEKYTIVVHINNNVYTNVINYLNDYPSGLQIENINAFKYQRLTDINNYLISLGYDSRIYLGPNGHIIRILTEDNIYVHGTIETSVEDIDNEINLENLKEDLVGIYKFNEISKEIQLINCGWKWSGGKIDGVVTKNITGETILTIGEYLEEGNNNIPLKHINLNKCSSNDDESLYTQTPDIPITNLHLVSTFSHNIPNGVYQFFVRYKIRDNFYTGWIPCSKECFAGTSKVNHIINGKVKHVNIKTDAGSSFIFEIDHLFENICNNYESFQIGYLLTHEEQTVARSWKHFNFNDKTIYFDLQESDIKEINQEDLLRPIFDLHNVKNIAYFKDRLYVSNYVESDVNEGISDIEVNISFEQKDISSTQARTTYDEHDLDLNNGVYSQKGKNNIDDLINIRKHLNITSNTGNNTEEGSYEYTSACWNLHFAPNYGSSPWLFYAINNEVIDNGHGNTITGTTNFNWQDVGYDNWAKYFDVKDPRSGGVYLKPVNEDYSVTRKRHPLQKDINHPLYNNWYFLSDGNTGNTNVSDYTWCSIAQYRDKNSYLDLVSQKMIQQYNRAVLPDKLHVTEITLFDSNNNSHVVVDDNRTISDPLDVRTDGTYLKFNSIDEIEQYVIHNIIKPNAIGFTDGGNIVCKIGNDTQFNLTNFSVKYSKFNYTLEVTDDGDDKCTFKLGSKRHNYIFAGICLLNMSYFKTNDDSVPTKQYNTLMPHTDYEFYIHFVKANGVITNGYYIGTKNTGAIISKSDKSLLTPYFELLSGIPKGYVACFYSYYKKNKVVAELFNIHFDNLQISANCLELDTLLINKIKDLTVKCLITDAYSQNPYVYTFSNTAKYYPSYADDINHFGCAGDVILDITQDEADILANMGSISHMYFTKSGWMFIVEEDVSESDKETKELIKCTPYIKEDINGDIIFSDFEKINTDSYICGVVKPSKTVADDYYVADTDVYGMTNGSCQLTPINAYISLPTDTYTNIKYIYSNYNLNYLNLHEDIDVKLRSYEIDQSTRLKQMFPHLNSATLSDCYELQSMYRKYLRKSFIPKQDNAIIEFNNTIRASNYIQDEAYNNIYNFFAETYYNIPTNRGKIVKLFSINKYIYVHCEHTLYRFSGNNTLNGAETDIKLAESNVFETGIEDVFDAEYGFGGIQKKEHSIIEFNNYVFYDKIANTIYTFGGNNNIQSLNNNIQKFLDDLSINDVIFGGDFKNSRIFININSNKGDFVLSYNIASKSFVSLHDFSFNKAISTRNNCYFIKNTNYFYDNTHTIEVSILGKINHELTNTYSHFVSICPILVNRAEDIVAGEAYSVIDVLFNVEYESVKVLNYIKWICNKIISYNAENNGTYIVNNKQAEEVNQKYPGDILFIYSDVCNTDLLDLHDVNNKISNDFDISSDKFYIYPRFNNGVWTINKFRNISNRQYPEPRDEYFIPDPGEPGREEAINNQYGLQVTYADDDSLVYGKYFVIRFIFDRSVNNFKLENVIISANKDEAY